MAKRKKRFTDSERSITEQIDKRDWFTEDSAWFKEQVEAKKDKIDLSMIEDIKIECRLRNGVDTKQVEIELDEEGHGRIKKKKPKDPIYHLKDICKVLDWEFPRDKEERTKLAKFSNSLQIVQGANSAQMLWNGMLAIITRDSFEDPTDMFLSKKEARKGRKRKKSEARHGEERKIRIPKTEEEKKAARKERARLRKEAQKLNITVDEVRKLEEEKASEPVESIEPKKVAKPRKKSSTKKTATAKKPASTKKTTKPAAAKKTKARKPRKKTA